MKRKCSECGKKVKKRFKYCGKCGALVPDVNLDDMLRVKCSGCGSFISPSIQSCNVCGVELSGNEKTVKKARRKILGKVIGFTLLALLGALILCIGLYIGAGFLFKNDSFELDNYEEIIDNIDNYMSISFEDDELYIEIEEEAINAYIINSDIIDIIENTKIKIDDIYFKSKTLSFVINSKIYGLSVPIAFSFYIEDDEEEVTITIEDLKFSSLNLPMPAWIANIVIKRNFDLTRDDDILPQNIFYESIRGSKRDVELTLIIDAEQIIRNVKKELDKADENILRQMIKIRKLQTSYTILSNTQYSDDILQMMIMDLFSRREIHAIYLPFNKSFAKEEMGTIFYDLFKMDSGLDFLSEKLDSED